MGKDVTVKHFYNHNDGFVTNQSEAEKNDSNSYKIGALISPVYGNKKEINHASSTFLQENLNEKKLTIQQEELKTEQSIMQEIVDSVVSKKINNIKPKITPNNNKSNILEIKNSILLKQHSSIPDNIFFPRSSQKSFNSNNDLEQLEENLNFQKNQINGKNFDQQLENKKYQQINLFDDKEK